MPRVLPQTNAVRNVSRLAPLFILCILTVLTTACQGNRRVIILVDGQRRVVQTRADTVDQVLSEQGIKLGEDDRVNPPGFTPLERTATIEIVRIKIENFKTQIPVEFKQQFTHDETIPAGKVKVISLGENGVAEITTQVTYQDGKEVSRREISRITKVSPHDEILAVGTQDSLPQVAVAGTLVYLAHGNAWLIRDSSKDKRPLTFEGDLDGRVFDLSADGRFLLYTRAVSGSLNSLWLANILVLDERPRRVPLDNLLYAEWARDGSYSIAYSTGERTAGAPGWKANNDLYLGHLNGVTETLTISTSNQSGATPAAGLPNGTGSPTSTVTTTIAVPSTAPVTVSSSRVVSPSVPAPYAWWGGKLAWAPDIRAFAFSFANQVGFINTSFWSRRAARQFAFYNPHAEWVWTPQVTWSPDSRFVAVTVHAPPEGAGPPSESPIFDLWVLARDSTFQLDMVRNTGMWSSPTWSPRAKDGESKLAYGVAVNPANSETSPYALWVMDRDGSHRAKIYPQSDESALSVIQVAWSPSVDQLVAIRDQDLWLYDFGKGRWTQLTANGDSRLARWR